MLHEETPQYKVLKNGIQSISDVELIAGIICNGNTPNKMALAIEIARTLIVKFNGLKNICRESVNDLSKYMTVSQALRLTSAIELYRRKITECENAKKQISSSKDAYDCLVGDMCDLYHEEFWVLFINKANEVIGKKRMSIGGTAGTIADTKLVFKECVSRNGCAGIIIAHNHPSGSLSPSNADNELTKKMVGAGKLMDIMVLDHLIISCNGYYSFADQGKI